MDEDVVILLSHRIGEIMLQPNGIFKKGGIYRNLSSLRGIFGYDTAF